MERNICLRCYSLVFFLVFVFCDVKFSYLTPFEQKTVVNFFCLLMFGVKVATLIETGFSHFSSCYNLSFSSIIDFRASNSAFSYMCIYALIVVYNFCSKVRFMC